ncbi:MAG: quinolinate synthase NadA [Deltaproteobacteria bacterium]|jgi:quinolinate synthase|nr:quinolinate synthase NadA [Deltaproteobacteria bacterium]
MADTPFAESITRHRQRMGASLTVMAHHYQCDEVIRHADVRGDSLELALRIRDVGSEHIAFCSVYFMAESAALLARDDQKIYLPEPSAECSMALMSPAALLDSVLSALGESGRTIVPLAYVNSTLAVKAVVGKRGGAVCTSANAKLMLQWALERGDAVLFAPDKNLGQNTADLLNLPRHERHVLKISNNGGNIDRQAADAARLLLWPGFCSIHTRFNLRQIDRARAEHAGAVVAVHPECSPEVVAAADAVGSTAFLIRYAGELPKGATVVVGTEINLVERLAAQYAGRITVLPLVESACTHMAQTTEESLAAALDSLETDGPEASPYRVRIADELRTPAKAALERMIAACEAARP